MRETTKIASVITKNENKSISMYAKAREME